MFGDFCTNLYIVGDRPAFQPNRRLVEAIVRWCNSYRDGIYPCESIVGGTLSRELVDRHFQDWGDIVAEAEGIDRQDILQEFALAAWQRLGEITPEVVRQLSNASLPGISPAERQNIQQLRIIRDYWLTFLTNVGLPAAKKVRDVCWRSHLNVTSSDIWGLLLYSISSPEEFFKTFKNTQISGNSFLSSLKAYAYRSIVYQLYERLRHDYKDPNIGRSNLSIPFRYSSRKISAILRGLSFTEEKIESYSIFINSTKEYLKEKNKQINNLTATDFDRIASYTIGISPLPNINITGQRLKEILEEIGVKLRNASRLIEISSDELYSELKDSKSPEDVDIDPPQIVAIQNFFSQYLQHLQESNWQDACILWLYYGLRSSDGSALLTQGEIASILGKNQPWVSHRITNLANLMYTKIQEEIVNPTGSLQMTPEQDIGAKRAMIQYLRFYMDDRLRQEPPEERFAYIADRTGLPLPLPDKVRVAIEFINGEPHIYSSFASHEVQLE
jgi:hypothetical protein